MRLEAGNGTSFPEETGQLQISSRMSFFNSVRGYLSTQMGIHKLLTKGDKAKAKSQLQTDSGGVLWPSFLCGKA